MASLAGWLRVTAAATSFPGGVERSPTRKASHARCLGDRRTPSPGTSPHPKSTSQVHIPIPHPRRLYTSRSLDHDAIKWNRIMISSLCLSMIFSENRFPLFRIMLWCSGSEVRIMTAASSSCGLLNQSHTNGVDLTFATLPIASSKSECQIQNSIRNRYLLVVLGFQHSQACLPRRDANVGIGPLESMSC